MTSFTPEVTGPGPGGELEAEEVAQSQPWAVLQVWGETGCRGDGAAAGEEKWREGRSWNRGGEPTPSS